MVMVKQREAGSSVMTAANIAKQGLCFGNSIVGVFMKKILLWQFAVKCSRHLLEAKHLASIGFEDDVNTQIGGMGQNGPCMQMRLVTSLKSTVSSKYWSVFKDLFWDTAWESVTNVFHFLGTVLASQMVFVWLYSGAAAMHL